jgi:hypothetical protein
VTEGLSIIIDQESGGGYAAWSTDDDDLKVEAPTLLAVDQQVRRYLHGHLADDERHPVPLAYV